MGLLDFLTKEIKLTAAVMHWREPMMFRIRLRNDLWLRLLVVLGAWLAASGSLLILFSFSQRPAGAGTAFGLALIGAGFAYLAILSRRKHVSGSCWLYNEKLQFQSMSTDITGGVINHTTWDYDVVDQVALVSAQQIGKSFSVMLITSCDDQLMIGIPNHVDLKTIADFFLTRQIEVSSLRNLPETYTRSFPMPIGLSAPVLGCALVTTGLVLSAANLRDDQQREAARPQFQQLDAVMESVRPADLPGHGTKVAAPKSRPSQSTKFPPDVPAGPDIPVPNGFGFRPEVGLPNQPVPSPRPPARQPGATSPANHTGSDSELLGGKGGIPFRVVGPNGQPVVAVQYATGAWAGKERVGKLTPLFERIDASPHRKVVSAKDGYALGAMQVDADDLVNAVRFAFMRVKADGSLDATDSYGSEWIGEPNE
ncbi:MAG TPA: hypothetical protein VMM76_28535, partial [Pirellulaceae bacterium]|nr:hypothetical protein [Pirellulaceae bacterium]